MKKVLLSMVVLLLLLILLLIVPSNQIQGKQNENRQNNIAEKNIVYALEIYRSMIVNDYTEEGEINTYDYNNDVVQEMQEKMNNINCIESKMEWFLEYKSIIDEYKDVIDSPETIYDYFTDEEIYLIQRTVETECYDADFISKVHVANVIFNRLESNNRFGNNITDIITRKNQFAYFRTEISYETILAVEYAFEIEDLTQGSIAFRSDKNPDTWYGWEYVFSDNVGHHFYR